MEPIQRLSCTLSTCTTGTLPSWSISQGTAYTLHPARRCPKAGHLPCLFVGVHESCTCTIPTDFGTGGGQRLPCDVTTPYCKRPPSKAHGYLVLGHGKLYYVMRQFSGHQRDTKLSSTHDTVRRCQRTSPWLCMPTTTVRIIVPPT